MFSIQKSRIQKHYNKGSKVPTPDLDRLAREGMRFTDAHSPATVRKQIVDRAFCEGLNRITYHGYSHSPVEAGFPGRTYHAGVDMNPQVVWWSKARPFMDYLARCCYLLQKGLFVADVAYFYGDQAPNFWPLFHDIPEKPLLPGLGAGYDYDVVNSDVILNRMSVRDGRVTLPDGMSYRVLVLPEQVHMPLAVLSKLEQLVADGATVIGPKPLAVPGMRNHADQTAQLRTLADKLWGPCDGTKVTEHRHGKGKVVWGLSTRDYLARQSIEPDFACLDATQAATLDYIHRQTPEADIYFVRNTTLSPVHANCRFRVEHRGAPWLWDPADGSSKPLFVHEVVDGGTRVLLDMPPDGSAFVVFEKRNTAEGVRALAATAADPALPAPAVLSLDGGKAVLRIWQNGQHTLTDRSGREHHSMVGLIPTPLVIDDNWAIAFDPKWGAPANFAFPQLRSWTDHENEGIKYFSGLGVYTRTLEVPADWVASDRGVHLDLGDVRELAEVFVNGKSAGVLWKSLARHNTNHEQKS